MKYIFLILVTILSTLACSSASNSTPVDGQQQNPLEATATLALLQPTPSSPDSVQAATTLPPTNTPTAVTTKLVIWENLPPAQHQKLAEEVAEFQGTIPAAIIELQHYDDVEGLAVGIAENRVDYDILLGPAALLQPLHQIDKLQPLGQLFSPGFLDAFASVTLTGAMSEGQLWGLPDTAGFHLMLFYNRDLVENPPTTTEELEVVARRLTNNTQWGLVLNSYEPLWVLPWVWSYEGWLTDEAGNLTLTSPAVISALTLYANWHQADGGFIPLTSHTEARELFLTGNAAMLIDGDWAIDELTQEATIPWGVALLPTLSETEIPPSPLILGRYWAVGTETTGRKTEVAIAFLEYITTGERQLDRLNQFGLLPTRRDTLANPQVLSDPFLRVSVQQLQAGHGLSLNIDVDTTLAKMRPPLEQLLHGKITPEEAVEKME